MTQADYARHDRITLTGITAKGYFFRRSRHG